MPAVRIRESALALAVAAVAVGVPTGCGNSRTRPPGPRTATLASGSHIGAFPSAGVAAGVPTGWLATAGDPPLLMTMRSGDAVVAIWRYPRTQALPAHRTALERAIPGLLDAVRARDPGFRLDNARALRVAGQPAIQVVGFETIDGTPRRVRSEHIFAYGAEVVVDAYAPPGAFTAVNRSVFVPLLQTLVVRRPQ